MSRLFKDRELDKKAVRWANEFIRAQQGCPLPTDFVPPVLGEVWRLVDSLFTPEDAEVFRSCFIRLLPPDVPCETCDNCHQDFVRHEVTWCTAESMRLSLCRTCYLMLAQIYQEAEGYEEEQEDGADFYEIETSNGSIILAPPEQWRPVAWPMLFIFPQPWLETDSTYQFHACLLQNSGRHHEEENSYVSAPALPADIHVG